MNPPSAIQGAMGRERKPFTYTPGGLDLSEIKSERMAKRLMRNAMNQGVPEVPVQSQHAPTSSTSVAIPNYSCLPVQVFPSFTLPSNPKALLRTRSHPEPPKQQPLKAFSTPEQLKQQKLIDNEDTRGNVNKNVTSLSQINSNSNDINRATATHEYNMESKYNTFPRTTYGSSGYTDLPEISYDAEYLQTCPSNDVKEDQKLLNWQINSDDKQLSDSCQNLDVVIEPLSKTASPTSITETLADSNEINDEQREVKVVKKQVTKESKTQQSENLNGTSNGDTEAKVVVKLPTKKSAAKTETNVEVVKKTLPDGTIEETKTTTTKTTVDGKTQITTRTETRTIPKDIETEEDVEEIEETEDGVVEEYEEEEVSAEKNENTESESVVEQKPKQPNGSIIKKEGRSETTIKKKVVIIQDTKDDEEEEEESEVEEVEEEIVEDQSKNTVIETVTKEIVSEQSKIDEKEKTAEVEEELEDEEEEEIEEEVQETESKVDDLTKNTESTEEPNVEKVIDTVNNNVEETPEETVEEEVEEEEEYEEAEDIEKTEPKPEETVNTNTDEKDDENGDTESEIKEESKEVTGIDEPKSEKIVQEEPKEEPAAENETKEIKVEVVKDTESTGFLKEPSVPLEKVEDVEIKPIGLSRENIVKTHFETKEISTESSDKPSGLVTEYKREENIVTVNKTTEKLDRSYEEITQSGIPTLKTYFAPDRDRVAPQSAPIFTPYQPVYPSQPTTERRHSLLLERLSVERQLPSAELYQNSYQNINQNYEQQRQWSQEPQSEVLTVSNIKPSKITNQQWYQNNENVLYNNVTSSTPAQSYTQSQTPYIPTETQNAPSSLYQPEQYQSTQQAQSQYQSQPQYQAKPQFQTQPQYQAQPQYQPQPPQPQYQAPPQIQIQSDYQQSYSDHTKQEYSSNTNSSYLQNNYSTYTPKPTTWTPGLNQQELPRVAPQTNYSSTESYQKSTQQYSSSYVPPPWEQDSTYVVDTSNQTQNTYQPPPPSKTFSTGQSWKPIPPAPKFSRPAPTASAYVPPAPNQSFVKPVNVVEQPKVPGKKTYYSEYERRYITVPENNYVPGESKFQAQPDPSPKYYYDNQEPTEQVEHEWRKELREFTEKSSTEYHTEETSVRPPWEQEMNYKNPTVTYTPTLSWSQTVKPRSYRERSFEAEYIGSPPAQEWPKTNTLGRNRPMSTYVQSRRDNQSVERTRGVSVDRFNPNTYQSPIPSEHSPVHGHTLTPVPPGPHARQYHNPNVPAYHSRASAEPREQPAAPYPRNYHKERASPLQSRSFKYLQWITGTDD